MISELIRTVQLNTDVSTVEQMKDDCLGVSQQACER